MPVAHQTPPLLPPRPGSITDQPTFHKMHSVPEDAATIIPRTRPGAPANPPKPATPAVPEGMSLRTPRASSQPSSRTQTPVQPARTATPSTPPPIAGRAPTGPGSATPNVPRAPTGPGSAAAGRTPTPQQPAVGRTPTPMRAPSPGGPVIPRTISQSRAVSPNSAPGATPRPTPLPARARSNTAATLETEALIRDRLALVDRSADHFNLLGIAQDATPDLIRAAYFTLARKLHPDRLASLGIGDSQRDGQRLFAQINAAFAVLNDTVKRTEYMSILSRGGESAVRAEEAKADELAMAVMHAEEAFRRGEMALRREQLESAIAEFTTAAELQPQETDYQALLTWAKFAIATDKQAIVAKTRIELQRAAEKSQRSPTARFYLGRVERIMGREREALDHFHQVLRIKPNHQEATSEVRVLESRLKKK
jgi:DnaJ-domain-containing protein 1